MLEPFRSHPKEARREHLAAYHQYLVDRDGELDIANQRLSRREVEIERFLRPSRTWSIDRSLFDAQYASFDPRVAMPDELLILLALVKINAAEAYGVDTSLPRVTERLARGEIEGVEAMLLVEETYHTRILLSSSRLFGFDVRSAYTPAFALKTLIGLLGATPKTFSRPLLLASELVGTILFLELLTRIRELLAGQGELRDAIEERLIDVLVDEIGHVTFNQLCLGPVGLAEARALAPLVAGGMASVVPELRVLGALPTADRSVLAQLPEAVKKQAFLV